MIRIRGLTATALAISTTWCCDALRRATRARTSMPLKPIASRIACAWRCAAGQSIHHLNRRLGMLPRRMFSVTLRLGTRLTCWCTMRMPSCWPRSGLSIACGAPSSRISPASDWIAPVRIRVSVLLPAPFSPTIACTSPRRAEKSTLRSACVPP